MIAVAASACSGAALALACPPLGLVPLAWIALAALAYLLGRDLHDPSRPRTRLQRAFEGGGRGLAFGMAANMVGQRFVPDVVARFTPLPWAAGLVALALLGWAQGLVWWVVGAARARLVRAGIPPWCAFALAVYAGTFVPSIFPWTPAGVAAT